MTKKITTLHAKDLMSEMRDRFASPKESPESQNAADFYEIFENLPRAFTWEINYFALRVTFDNLLKHAQIDIYLPFFHWEKRPQLGCLCKYILTNC